MDPDFLLHSGDSIYADGPLQKRVSLPDGTVWQNIVTPEKSKVAETLDEYRGQYRYNLLDDNVRGFAAQVPQLTFDGPEDRNGTRNADEIRFWADYVSPGKKSRYIYDDAGVHGGLRPGEPFVIMGDLNADPADDGDGIDGGARQVTDHRSVRDPLPASEGAVEASALQGGANLAHAGDPAYDTADFSDVAPGNLRADYVLPSRPLRVLDAGVFWPAQSDPLSRLTGTFDRQYTNGFPSSDHRLVWVDVAVPGSR